MMAEMVKGGGNGGGRKGRKLLSSLGRMRVFGQISSRSLGPSLAFVSFS